MNHHTSTQFRNEDFTKMNAVKGLFGYGKSDSSATKEAPPPPPPKTAADVAQERAAAQVVPPTPTTSDPVEFKSLQEAAAEVNQAKALYDNCEVRRMREIANNGTEAEKFSCEREFQAFKKAFDMQLSLEAKQPPLPRNSN